MTIPLERLINHPKIIQALQELVDMANEGMDHWSTIKHFRLLTRPPHHRKRNAYAYIKNKTSSKVYGALSMRNKSAVSGKTDSFGKDVSEIAAS